VRDLGSRDERFGFGDVPYPVWDGDPDGVKTIVGHPVRPDRIYANRKREGEQSVIRPRSDHPM
jgi:hypothetical protein